MKHIRQINSVYTNSYTVVVTDDWNQPLEEHPSVVEHPELFEISEDVIPVKHQYLIYESA
jgi:hypothetical protein